MEDIQEQVGIEGQVIEFVWGEHIGFSTPYSWFGVRLLAIFEEGENVLEESDEEEGI
jgi:hypothetical protein